MARVASKSFGRDVRFGTASYWNRPAKDVKWQPAYTAKPALYRLVSLEGPPKVPRLVERLPDPEELWPIQLVLRGHRRARAHCDIT